MVIKDVVLSKGLTGFYFDDQKAIRQGDFKEDGLTYDGPPLTPGFTRIRQAGESVSVQLILADGQVAYGDCAAVQYSGAGGRDPLFLAQHYLGQIEEVVVPALLDQKITDFREMAKSVEELKGKDGKPLHTAIRYGVTQALLDAVARKKKISMAEVIAEEYDLELTAEPIRIFTQSGDERHINADRMIIKKVDVLPHGLFNNIKKLGKSGEHLRDYLHWLKQRVQQLGEAGYCPDFHVDVYGTIGEAFQNDIEKIGDYAGELAKIAAPHKLLIEGPIECADQAEQIRALVELREYVDQRQIPVLFVVDEWCNTLEDIKAFARAGAGHMIQIKAPDLGSLHNSVEAVLYCHEHNMIPYLGGTCNETERSTQVCVHVAMATRPRQILSKPGMGVDEGLSIVTNEMNRLAALIQRRQGRG